MPRGRKSYDTSDPFAYPVSRLARAALYERLEFAVTSGKLKVDHQTYVRILESLFPEDFAEVQATGPGHSK